MAAVILTDGSMLSAPTFRGLEEALRLDPWNPSKKQAFRAEMAFRAWVWSSTDVGDTFKSSRAFFEELEYAGMLRIIDDTEEER